MIWIVHLHHHPWYLIHHQHPYRCVRLQCLFQITIHIVQLQPMVVIMVQMVRWSIHYQLVGLLIHHFHRSFIRCWIRLNHLVTEMIFLINLNEYSCCVLAVFSLPTIMWNNPYQTSTTTMPYPFIQDVIFPTNSQPMMTL